MSEVISFRLSPENPREAIALQVLKRRLTEGYSVRLIITDALILSEDKNYERDFENHQTNLQATLNDISEVLHQLKMVDFNKIETNTKVDAYKDLSDSFISSVISTIKPGMKDA